MLIKLQNKQKNKKNNGIGNLKYMINSNKTMKKIKKINKRKK